MTRIQGQQNHKTGIIATALAEAVLRHECQWGSHLSLQTLLSWALSGTQRQASRLPGKRSMKPEQNIQELWVNNKRCYIHVIRIPEGGEKEIFEIIMEESFPKLITPNDRSRRLRKHQAGEIPRNLHVCTVDP